MFWIVALFGTIVRTMESRWVHAEGSRAAASPGSFFFYLITGAHGALVIVGLAFLGSVGVGIGSTRASARNQSVLGIIAHSAFETVVRPSSSD